MSYITFKNLGASADLGSQIQQYASLYAIAQETGKQIIFPESSKALGWGFKFDKVLDVDITFAPDSFFKEFIDIAPKGGSLLDQSMFSLHKDTNYNVTGTFDTYLYWHSSHKTAVDGWNWKAEYLSTVTNQYNKLKLAGKETVAIHVRRGNYLLPQHHHFCKLDTQGYYEQSLQHFFTDIDKYQFFIFSNDIEWCKQNLIEESEIVTFVDTGVDYNDLVLMSLCDHNIIANSSFSWWAAYKNKNSNKKIICPTNYVYDYSPAKWINGTYYPLDWTNIDNI
jgi:hypothetical protein